MDRNKYIYAMADYSFVAQSDTRGGTWTGIVEDLKRPAHHPLYVYMGRSRDELPLHSLYPVSFHCPHPPQIVPRNRRLCVSGLEDSRLVGDHHGGIPHRHVAQRRDCGVRRGAV